MLTTHALSELEQSLGGRRVLSVYLDGRVSDPASRRAWRTRLETSLAALRRDVAQGNRAEASELDGCIGQLDELLAPVDGALGAPGFVAFVTAAGIALGETLPVPPPNVTRWCDGPWTSPYIHGLKELRPVVVAIVDSRSARVYHYVLGALTRLEVLRAHAHVGPSYHMGGAPRQHFHPGTRGSTGSDAAERALNEGTERLLRKLTAHLARFAGDDGRILLGGAPAVAHAALRMLPTHIATRAAWTREFGIARTEAEVRRCASEGASRLGRKLDGDLVDAVIEHAASQGRGATGATDVQAALALRSVQTLLLTSGFVDAQQESAEEMVRAALAQGAQVEIIAGAPATRLDADAGGVGAVLRFPRRGGATTSSAMVAAATDWVREE